MFQEQNLQETGSSKLELLWTEVDPGQKEKVVQVDIGTMWGLQGNVVQAKVGKLKMVKGRTNRHAKMMRRGQCASAHFAQADPSY